MVFRPENWLIGVKRSSPFFRYASDNKRLSYNHWGSNQPSDKDDCVLLQENTLMSVPCSKKSFFICEVPPTTERMLSYEIEAATGNMNMFLN